MIKYKIPQKIEALLLLVIISMLLIFGQFALGSFVKTFSSLSSYSTFSFLFSFGLVGLLVYMMFYFEKRLKIPLVFSGIFLGLMSAGIFNFLYPNLELPLSSMGLTVVSFFMFRRALSVNVKNRKKDLIKGITVGTISAIILFSIIGVLLDISFPSINTVTLYIIAAIILILGNHTFKKSSEEMDITRFFMDLVLVGLVYGLTLWGSRFLPSSLFSPFESVSFFVNITSGIILGSFVGLLGAYMLHRHHNTWSVSGQKEDWYILALFFGIIALSILVGGNPIIAGAIMGLLVQLKDEKDAPEDSILPNLHSFIYPIIALVVGYFLSIQMMVVSLPYLALFVLVIFFPALFLSAILIFVLTHYGKFSRTHFMTVLSSVYDKNQSLPLVLSLGIFAASSVMSDIHFVITIIFTLVIVNYTIFPYLRNLFIEVSESAK
jgi:NhaP-type Na+/H+ or K+/H+ antiporter